MAVQRPKEPGGPRGILCPYCGRISPEGKRCAACGGFFDPLSRQATQNSMGPWFIRDDANPFRPGCSFETVRELARRGRLTTTTVIRGPTTRQFWNLAGRTPSVANLLGLCHNCRREVNPDAAACAACGASFSPEIDRQHLGLAPVHLLPGQAPPESIAAAAMPAASAAQGTRAEPAPVATIRVVEASPPSPAPKALIGVLVAVVLLLAAGLAAVVIGPSLGWDMVGALGLRPPSPPAPEVEPEPPPEAAPVPAAPGTVERAEPEPGAEQPTEPEPTPGPPPGPPASAVQPDGEEPIELASRLAPAVWPWLDQDPIDLPGLEADLRHRGAGIGLSAEALDQWMELARRRAAQRRFSLLP